MKYLSESSQVHEIVDREVLGNKAAPTPRAARFPSLLSMLAMEDEAVVSQALGDAGIRLRAFANAVQGSQHPDLYDINSGILNDEEEFATMVNEMVVLTSLAFKSKLNTILPHINKIVSKFSSFLPRIKDLDDPNKNLNYVRFIADPTKRSEIRRKKKIQVVNIQGLLQKSPEQWEEAGESFASLARNQIPFLEDAVIAERRAEAFNSVGAGNLSIRLQKRAIGYRNSKKDQYYGFNRLSVTSASIIAGKLMECNMASAMGGSSRVTVPLSTCEDMFAKIDGNSEIRNRVVVYEPRLYPLHTVEHTCSERTKKLIEVLDNFPESNGCPIFDHFWCLVPSLFVLNIPSRYGSKPSELDDLTRSFDLSLLKHGATPSVLLADKDGKTYFVDYWC